MRIRGFASTEVKDRQGDIVLATAFTEGLADFSKNPVLLFQHKTDEVIGKVVEANIIPGEGLEIVAELSASLDEKTQTLIEEGILKGFSIGFNVKDVDFEEDQTVIKELDLHEISIVSIPANQDSLFKMEEKL